ncbi:hypothetical protein [Bordetella genomosp. 9]|uniref:Uncharacterized protein n=1 Tax=Bordetella genomosp. 9 TaxID=1416803 RepID=A0A1W6YV03_9BORD|nr:hypothetical protein [Bordetella genomosp. 9]ARP84798.1 hypothetical protein CAL13_00070 [Bordetella genomosp. 9]ARP88890.1 hypothetical protein CAL14_00070 [Bordetella genomosp. 9]
MLPQPDPNRNAPRPSKKADLDDPRPDMDHPPGADPQDQPVFDRATAAAEDDARDGAANGPQNPTPPETGRHNKRGTLRRSPDDEKG